MAIGACGKDFVRIGGHRRPYASVGAPVDKSAPRRNLEGVGSDTELRTEEPMEGAVGLFDAFVGEGPMEMQPLAKSGMKKVAAVAAAILVAVSTIHGAAAADKPPGIEAMGTPTTGVIHLRGVNGVNPLSTYVSESPHACALHGTAVAIALAADQKEIGLAESGSIRCVDVAGRIVGTLSVGHEGLTAMNPQKFMATGVFQGPMAAAGLVPQLKIGDAR